MTNPEVAGQDSDLNGLLAHVEILSRRDNLVDARVGFGLINSDDVPIDEVNIAKLSESFADQRKKGNETGQLSPIILGQVEGYDRFFIVDGFHRTAILKRVGAISIYATITPPSTLDELNDLRILTAEKHSSVSFGRVVDWVSGAWERTPWAEKVNVVRAFGLNQANVTGANMGLTPTEVTDIKLWMAKKSTQWGRATSGIHRDLVIAKAADPDLVRLVRKKPSSGAFAFTNAHLKTITDILPMEYGVQKIVHGLIVARKLSVLEARTLARQFKGVSDIQEAAAIANETDWERISRTRTVYDPQKRAAQKPGVAKRAVTTKVVVPARSNKPLASKLDLGSELVIAELEIGKLALANQVLSGAYVPTGEKTGRQYAVEGIGNNSKLWPAARPLYSESNRKPVDAVYERMRASIVGQLVTNRGLNDGEAGILAATCYEHVLFDATEGDLRFVCLEPGPHTFSLFNKAIQLELGRRQQEDTAPLTIRRLESDSSTASVKFDVVLGALPYLRPESRQAFLLTSLLGLSRPSVSRIVGQRRDALDKSLGDTYTTILGIAARSNDPQPVQAEAS
ncbi:MAG: ParB/Srx family N-terminal domain-containing protein [Candidatus Saccharimonadales bacterium]